MTTRSIPPSGPASTAISINAIARPSHSVRNLTDRSATRLPISLYVAKTLTRSDTCH